MILIEKELLLRDNNIFWPLGRFNSKIIGELEYSPFLTLNGRRKTLCPTIFKTVSSLGSCVVIGLFDRFQTRRAIFA